MKIGMITALSAALLSPLATAGISIVAIPDTPTIEAPTADAVDVSITPEISGTAPSATRTGPPTPALVKAESEDYPVSLDTAEWLFFEPQDNLTILGGYEQSYPDLATSKKDWIISSPISFSIDDETVTDLQIYNNGTVILLNSNGDELAWVDANPDYTSRYQSGEVNAVIYVRAISSTLMTVTWQFENSEFSQTTWSNTLQAVIETTEPAVGFKMSLTDFDDDFFTINNGYLGCGIRYTRNIDSVDTIFYGSASYTPAELKTAYDASKESDSPSNASRVCYFDLLHSLTNANPIKLAQYDDPTPVEAAVPAFHKVTTDENPHTLTTEEMLEPGKNYAALLRYAVTDNENFNAYSAWSEQIEFSTELNTKYAMSANATSAFTQGVAKTLTFTLTNNGSDAGEPRAEVRLPFNVLSGVKGTFNAAMAEGITASCNTSVVGTVTTLGCTLKGLAAGESADFTATITLNDLGSQDIEYRVCETLLEGCTNASFKTLNVTVSAQASEAPGNGDDTSSSSSGGGSTFWFLLLSLPLTLLRRSR